MGKATFRNLRKFPEAEVDESTSIIFGANLAPSTKAPKPSEKIPREDLFKPQDPVKQRAELRELGYSDEQIDEIIAIT